MLCALQGVKKNQFEIKFRDYQKTFWKRGYPILMQEDQLPKNILYQLRRQFVASLTALLILLLSFALLSWHGKLDVKEDLVT